MLEKTDMHKAGGILIKDRRVLVTRDEKEIFVAPGGSIEIGETASQALIRECHEELDIGVNAKDLKFFGTFYAQAAGDTRKSIRMDVYIIQKWKGEPAPHSEIEELVWIDSKIPQGMKVGSIFEHEVLPRLKTQNLIS